jgi:hypothetical protein
MALRKIEPVIPLQECEVGRVYDLYSRNLRLGVYTGAGTFIGIREKFRARFLDQEQHWDTGAPFGTARPLGVIPVRVPAGIPLQPYTGCFCVECGVEFIAEKEPERGFIKQVHPPAPCTGHGRWQVNAALFSFLDFLEKAYVSDPD